MKTILFEIFYRRDGLMKTSQLRVTLGEHHLGESEYPAAIIARVKKMKVHQDFVCGKYMNDVTLLELTEPIEWSESVQPACLPGSTGRAEQSDAFTGRSAIAAGWGWLGEDKSVCEYLADMQRII